MDNYLLQKKFQNCKHRNLLYNSFIKQTLIYDLNIQIQIIADLYFLTVHINHYKMWSRHTRPPSMSRNSEECIKNTQNQKINIEIK